jgi:hypothetical protein
MRLLRHQKSFFLLLSLFLITGCATEGAFEDTMAEMVGHPILHYEKLAGAPARKEQAVNGNEVYVYKLKNYKDCTVFYEVDNQGIVVSWWHKGTCLAHWF